MTRSSWCFIKKDNSAMENGLERLILEGGRLVGDRFRGPGERLMGNHTAAPCSQA